MEKRLTEEQINKICANLRALDFLEKNKVLVDAHDDMKNEAEKFKALIKKVIDELTDEERDEVLEIHKIQREALDKKLARKLKKPKKK